MCGINFYYTNQEEDVLVNYHILNKHRGPDNSSIININDKLTLNIIKIDVD